MYGKAEEGLLGRVRYKQLYGCGNGTPYWDVGYFTRISRRDVEPN